MFDTHAHLLSEQFDEDRPQLMECLAHLSGVSLPSVLSKEQTSLDCGEAGEIHELCVLEAATDVAYSEKAQHLAEEYDFIYCSAGVHPHDASNAEDGYLDKLAELLKHDKCVAVGEIGLDYHYDFSPRAVQKKVFAEQLDLAVQMNKPVIIHDREAHGDTMDMLKRHSKLNGVMHCYSGSLESAKEYIKMGFYISFAGPLTFKNAGRLTEIAAWAPHDRILAETDSPYLAPVPKRGKRNDSRNVRYIIQKIADIRGLDFEQAAALTMENGKKLFRIEG